MAGDAAGADGSLTCDAGGMQEIRGKTPSLACGPFDQRSGGSGRGLGVLTGPILADRCSPALCRRNAGGSSPRRARRASRIISSIASRKRVDRLRAPFRLPAGLPDRPGTKRPSTPRALICSTSTMAASPLTKRMFMICSFYVRNKRNIVLSGHTDGRMA